MKKYIKKVVLSITVLILLCTALFLTSCKSEGSESKSSASAVESSKGHDSGVKNAKAAGNGDKEAEEGRASEKAEEDYRYEDVLEAYYKFILSRGDIDNPFSDATGVWEAIVYDDFGNPLDKIGYTIIDINEDGLSELIIGRCKDESNQDGEPIIYDGFSYNAEEVIHLFEGWERNRWYLLKDNSFYNEGSGGAANSILGVYKISKGKKTLECVDFYFTDYADESFSEVVVYYNKNGDMDREKSQKLDMSDDEFNALYYEKRHEMRELNLTPFSEYAAEKGETVAGEYIGSSNLSIEYLDGQNYPNKYIEFIHEGGDNQAKVVFKPSTVLYEFKILDLSLEDVSEDGEMQFSSKKVFETAELSPEKPLIAELPFFGSIPNIGIEYTDKSGVTKRFSLYESGYDGSLKLSEF